MSVDSFLCRCVLEMRKIDNLDGVLRDCVGTCVYNVEYDALVCRVFAKEVLRGQVQTVLFRDHFFLKAIDHAHE